MILFLVLTEICFYSQFISFEFRKQNVLAKILWSIIVNLTSITQEPKVPVDPY